MIASIYLYIHFVYNGRTKNNSARQQLRLPQLIDNYSLKERSWVIHYLGVARTKLDAAKFDTTKPVCDFARQSIADDADLDFVRPTRLSDFCGLLLAHMKESPGKKLRSEFVFRYVISRVSQQIVHRVIVKSHLNSMSEFKLSLI